MENGQSDNREKNTFAKAGFKMFIEKHEKLLSILAFALGFLWDNLTLTRVDSFFDNLILTTYLILAASGIIILNLWGKFSRKENFAAGNLASFLTFIIQFCFGGLFSSYVVFYSRSASLVTNWPFLAFLAFFFLGNEFLKKRYLILTFQLSIFFIAAFSYFIFIVPVLFHSIGIWVFILSGFVSLILTTFLVFILRLAAPQHFKQSLRAATGSILGIYIVFNVMYFANIIPPIPLAIKEIGVYHNVKKTVSGYKVVYEPTVWFHFWKRESKIFHRMDGEPVFVFSSIFSPTDLNTEISHKWFYFDEKANQWLEKSIVSFLITGGRANGYRGFSVKENIDAGKWRVDVVTGRNQIIGRINFEVVENGLPILEAKIL